MITGDGDFTVMTAGSVELQPGARPVSRRHRGPALRGQAAPEPADRRWSSSIPELLGVGVDEATAVWVRPDRTFEVLGDGWVMVFDAAGATGDDGRPRDGKTRWEFTAW